MHITRGRQAGGSSAPRGETFTGSVWADPVMRTDDGTVVNNVFFEPGARTFWHYHERGQLLSVTSGTGLICTAGETPRVLRTGDIVWVPAGERHWHGGSMTCCMLHTAVSFGETHWLHEVDQSEYVAEPIDAPTDQV
ncbi:MAG: cupin domain-containing protein [Acidimicrobiales bacterium]